MPLPHKTLPTVLRAPAGRLGLTCGSLLLALACSGGDDTPVAEQDGATLFKAYCALCHAENGLGTMLGASFEGVRDHWDEAQLVTYMGDPKAFAASDPRLGKREMAAISDDVPTAARKKIAQHVLILMDDAR